VLAIGVDTHKAHLAVCAVDELGRLVAESSFANNPTGHRGFLSWALALPGPCRIGLEGAANFGAGLARLLVDSEQDVREVPATLTHRERRRTGRPGKCDAADALAIARIVARESQLAIALGSCLHRDLKLLVDYREQLLREQTRLRNRVHADLQILLPGYRESLGHLASPSRLGMAREMLAPLPETAAQIALSRIARLEAISVETNELKRRIRGAVGTSHPSLTAIAGVGPIAAARLLGETGDPRRFRSSAAFAMTCGVAPIPASSGDTRRYRLNRGGNRRLNQILYLVALTQARCYPPAQAYLERKRSEGKTWHEAVRSLKRHLADVVYRAMLQDQAGEALTT
jgi:transposase